jgi:hypothetical protein
MTEWIRSLERPCHASVAQNERVWLRSCLGSGFGSQINKLTAVAVNDE